MLTMQHVLRPYATAGVALVGASIIAVTPVAAPPIGVQVRPVKLVDAWSDLVANTTANLDNIISNASSSDITQVFSELVTNPYGVIAALANLDPTVTTDITSLPATISVDLPPGLELMIAGLGSSGATLTALESVAQQLESDPSFTNLSEGLATVLNAYLNGQDNISLLDGAITIPLYNGILAPETSADVNINLTSLIDALGLGNTPLTDLDLSSLLSQIGLGDLNLGSLFSDLGLSGDLLGNLLSNGSGVTDLGDLLNLLGLNGLDLPSLSLTNILSGLGLDTNVDLNSLNLDDVLTAFGINPNVDLGLGTILTALAPTDSALGTFLDTGLGTLLSSAALGDPLSGILSTLQAIPLIGNALSLSDLTNALNGTVADPITVGSLLDGGTLNDSLSNILTALGVDDVTPSGLTVGGLLDALGFSSATTGQLTLGSLLGDLGTLTNPILGLNITDLLNGLNLGDLLGDLGLSNLPIDLSNLGDLSGLNLGDLLGDLGLGDLANVSIEPLGGFDTLLADVVPQQILAALGM
jgi:hypothetical protein